jgi:dynein heavy chain 1
MDLKKNESRIKEVIVQAQGEVSSVFMKIGECHSALTDGARRVHQASQRDVDELHGRSGKLPEQVSSYQVCSFYYCLRLLTARNRGWDELFNKCSENLNSLTAMKLSPYYKGACLFPPVANIQ